MVKLSILIPTVSARESLLSRLLWSLDQQLTDEVEVIVHKGDDLGVGDKCNRMFSEAKGELVVSIDDDDDVPANYVESILKTYNGEDFIGYKILYTRNGRYEGEIVHDANRGDADYSTLLRHVSLKCPIKREIALKFPFTNGTGGDMAWCRAIQDSGLVKSAVFIDKFLYIYDFWDNGTIGPVPGHANLATQRNVGLYPYDSSRFRFILP